MATGDEIYLKGDSNREGSIRVREIANTDDADLPNFVIEQQVGGRWRSIEISGFFSAASISATPANWRGSGSETLIAAITAMLTLDATGGATGAVTDTPAEVLRDRISVMRFLPTAEHAAIRAATSTYDCVAAFEAAQAAAKKILLPEGRYYLSRAVRNVSGRVWEGQGPGTLLYNPRSAALTINWACFTLGNMHPGSIAYTSPASNQFVSYGLAAITGKQRKLPVTTPGDESQAAVGDFVLVRSVAETVAGGYNIPNFMHWSPVTAIDTSAHTITIADPVPDAVSPACFSVIKTVQDTYWGSVASGNSRAWELVRDVTITDLAFDARGLVGSRSGCYQCSVERISATNPEYLLSLNAAVKSKFRHIEGEFSDRFVEFKCGSHDTLVENVRGSVKPGTTTPNGGLDIGEQSRDIAWAGLDCTVGPDVTSSSAFPLTINARRIRGSRSVFRDDRTTAAGSGQVAFIKTSNFTGYGPADISLDDVTLVANSLRSHHMRIGDGTGSSGTLHPDGLVFTRLRCVGVTNSAKSIKYEANTGLCHLSASDLQGVLEVSSTGLEPSGTPNLQRTQTSAAAFHSLNATPEGIFGSPEGSISARPGNGSPYGALYVHGSAAGTASGWKPIIPLVAPVDRADASIVLNTSSGQIQRSNTARTVLRAFTVPTFSSALAGFTWRFVNLDTTSGFNLEIRNPDNSVICAMTTALGKAWVDVTWSGTSVYYVSASSHPANYM